MIYNWIWIVTIKEALDFINKIKEKLKGTEVILKLISIS